jgi:hypothetical protein
LEWRDESILKLKQKIKIETASFHKMAEQEKKTNDLIIQKLKK